MTQYKASGQVLTIVSVPKGSCDILSGNCAITQKDIAYAVGATKQRRHSHKSGRGSRSQSPPRDRKSRAKRDKAESFDRSASVEPPQEILIFVKGLAKSNEIKNN